jgi:toxin HigB-1
LCRSSNLSTARFSHWKLRIGDSEVAAADRRANAKCDTHVIRFWANSATRRFAEEGKNRFAAVDVEKSEDFVCGLDAASGLSDLSHLRSVGLHKLSGDRTGQWAMTVKGLWRICFRFGVGNAWDVEIVDYHPGTGIMNAVHPGRILSRELKVRDISANALALALRTPSGRIVDILNGKRGISPETRCASPATSAMARCSGSTCRRSTSWQWRKNSTASASRRR